MAAKQHDETTDERAKRLIREGGQERLEAFKHRRAELVAGGMTARKAYEAASKEFGPLTTAAAISEHLPSPEKNLSRFEADNAKLIELAAQIQPKDVTEHEEVRWVLNNRLRNFSDLKPEEIPSPFALDLWQHIRSSPSNHATVIQQLYAPLLKTVQPKVGISIQDDGRFQQQLAADFAWLNASTEGLEGEPDLSPANR